jgi:CBS domain-containing protein
MDASPLELVPLASVLAPPPSGGWHVGLADPARTVMTDFNERSLVVVAAGQQVDEALEVMKHAGVRLAFVLDDARSRVRGALSAYDVLGEKPIRHVQLVGGAREEVVASDIMDPVEEWKVLRLEDVNTATVGAVLALFQRVGRTHLAVVEREAGGSVRLRGVFSAAKLLRLTDQARKSAKTKGR